MKCVHGAHHVNFVEKINGSLQQTIWNLCSVKLQEQDYLHTIDEKLSVKHCKLKKKVIERGLLVLLNLFKKVREPPLKTHLPRATILLLTSPTKS